MRPDTTIYRQLPLYMNWRSTDSIDTLRTIMQEHEQGYFLNSSTFWEECLTDDRIGAVFDTRLGGITGADINFVAADDKRKSSKLADLLGGSDKTEDDGLWLRMVSQTTAEEILKWKIGIGVAFGQITWDTSDGQWVPKVTCWHPRFLRWDWAYWGFVVNSWGEPIVYLPKPDDNVRCDGKWFVWGGYRSWMNGLVRSLGVPYIDRGWNQRDAARYSEKYGMGIVEGKCPSGATPKEKADFENRLRGLGNEPTLVSPQGRTKDDPGWGIELHQVGGEGWQIFKGREDQLNTNIAVRVLGQNLTTEVAGGSLAASKVHEHIRGDVKRRDAEFFCVLREQVLTWWAQYATNDPDLAPYPRPSFDAPEDPTQTAQELLTIVQALKDAPPQLDEDAILEAHGLPIREGDALLEAIERKRAMQPPPPAFPGQGPAQGQPGGDQQEQQAKSAPNPVDLRSVTQLADAVSLKGTTKVRKQAKYQVAQARIAARGAGRAMGPFVEKVLSALDGAQSFDEVRKVIIAEARRSGADMDQVSKLIANVNLLARLHGREAALQGVLHKHG